MVQLSTSLGSRQTFTLSRPLKIRKGEFLALTIPTWAPAFAVNLSSGNNVWRSSREEGKCGQRPTSRPASRSRRSARPGSYGCDYKTARLLYWGYFVPR